MKNIKILAMDVDGTLTDGKINISNSGEIFKSFCVKDGYAIKHLLPENGILPVIITGRSSDITMFRAREIGIEYVYQDIKFKEKMIENLCKKFNVTQENIAYIGDDLNDFGIMQLVGVAACPANAVNKIKEMSHFVCTSNGGDGAVREFIEWIINGNSRV